MAGLGRTKSWRVRAGFTTKGVLESPELREVVGGHELAQLPLGYNIYRGPRVCVLFPS